MSGVSESDKKVQPAKQEGSKKEVKGKGKWRDEMREKLGLVEEIAFEDLCIYKVPSKLRKVKLDAYNPRVVSIGPIHRKSPLVAAIREDKWRYMLKFLERTRNPIECLDELTDAVYGFDSEVRRCYAEEIKLNKNELTEIMLLDGCFMLELFLRYDQKLKKLNYKVQTTKFLDDPILDNAWMITSLKQDLALLENQIPFFILKKLYDAILQPLPHDGMKYKPPSSVASLALIFFHPYLSQKSIAEDQLVKIEETYQFKHLLDLLHKLYFFPPPPAQPDTVININRGESTLDNGSRSDASAVQQTSSPCFFLSRIKIRREKKNSCPSESDPKDTKKWGFNYYASKLRESGVKIEKAEDHHLMNISWDGRRLRIPQLFIHETSSSLFRNLIAYEQCSLGSKPFVTSYAFLMKSLIRSELDSKLLRDREIMKCRLDDKEYLVQFPSILEEVVVKDNFHFRQVCDDVNDYCKSYCNLNKLLVFLRARILNDMKQLYGEYFSSTWSLISFLAAVALLILTCLQTYYTMNPRS